MKKIIHCLLVIAVCVGMVSCSSQETTTPSATESAKPLTTSDVGCPYWSDYQRFVATTELPEDFIYFEDLPNIGYYAGGGVLGSTGYDRYAYCWDEYETGYHMGLFICSEEQKMAMTPTTHEPSADMRTVESDKKESRQEYEYWQKGEVQYIYSQGNLYRVRLTIGGKFFEFYHLLDAPSFQPDTFMGKLLNKDTIEEAVEEFKKSIFAWKENIYVPEIYVNANTRQEFLSNSTIQSNLFGDKIDFENLLIDGYTGVFPSQIAYVEYYRYVHGIGADVQTNETLYISYDAEDDTFPYPLVLNYSTAKVDTQTLLKGYTQSIRDGLEVYTRKDDFPSGMYSNIVLLNEYAYCQFDDGFHDYVAAILPLFAEA